MSLKRRSDAQTHFRRLTPTELRHSSIAATWYVEQRRCTGRRPPRCSSCFFQTVFKIIYKNCSSNIGVSCCVQIQLEGTSVGNLFLIEKEKNAGRPFPFQNTCSFFRQPCYRPWPLFRAFVSCHGTHRAFTRFFPHQPLRLCLRDVPLLIPPCIRAAFTSDDVSINKRSDWRD